jgi:hypothetical protein
MFIIFYYTPVEQDTQGDISTGTLSLLFSGKMLLYGEKITIFLKIIQ